MTVGIAVLAAGAGSRFCGDTHKLAAPFGASSVLGCVLDAVCATGIDTLVVTGASTFVAIPPRFTVVANAAWAEGMSTSLQAGVRWAEEKGHDVLVVGLGDQPLVTTADWLRVAGCDSSPLAAATFGGRLRPPLRIASAAWPMLPVHGDEGARTLLRDRPDLVTRVPCDGEPADIDTVADLERWAPR